MDWGLVLAVAAVASLAAHLALDLRGLRRLLRTPHTRYHGLDPCARCDDAINGADPRREHGRRDILWTALTILVLLVHITLDFVA